MKRFMTTLFVSALTIALVVPGFAAPVTGTYTTSDIGGQLQSGRASVSRPTVNSGFPKVLHAQSWNGTTLGLQWELRCGIENTGIAPNTSDYNFGTGTGTIVFTQTFTGGQFELFNTGGAWGDGIANLNTTTVVSTVQMFNFQPVFSVINANTSGSFGTCALTFGLSNGVGMGETTSGNPLIVKPADYPAFLDGTCGPAAPTSQFGTWGTVITGIMRIDCPTPTKASTWGQVKQIYR